MIYIIIWLGTICSLVSSLLLAENDYNNPYIELSPGRGMLSDSIGHKLYPFQSGFIDKCYESGCKQCIIIKKY